MEHCVSVIMCVYNEQEIWLREAIESILSQTYNNIEFIIILDNPHNYELKEIINEYSMKDSRIKLIVNEKNIGLIKSLNKGLGISKGKYIARMDADDIAIPTRISKQVEFIENNKDISMVGAKNIYIDENGVRLNTKDLRATSYENIKIGLKFSNMFSHPTMLYKRRDIIKIGGYKDALYAEDYDLVLRFIINGYKICNIEEPLIYYRIRKNGISYSKKRAQMITSKFLQDEYKKNFKNSKLDINYKDLINIQDEEAKNDSLFKQKIIIKSMDGKCIHKIIYKLVSILNDKYYRRYYYNKLMIKALIWGRKIS